MPATPEVSESVNQTSGTAYSYSQYKWKRRLPASRFGSIVRAGKREREVANSILDLTFTESAATLYGKEHEADALSQLGDVLSLTIMEGKKIVPQSHRWLVCIPDGLVEEDGSIVEVKCPYKCRDKTFQTLAETDENFCLKAVEGGGLELDQEHDYYYQVQGMLNMMERETCYFAVWSPTQFHHQLIHRDKQFWQTIIFPKLLDFYRKHILDNKWESPDISEQQMEEGKMKILSELSLSEAEAAEVERRTRGQSDNTDWRTERSRRLTASNFGRVAKLRAATSRHNTVLSLIYPDDISSLPAIRHGRESEERALSQVGEVVGPVRRSGLFVDTNTGYLAASPDGVLDDETLVEIKCPLKCLEDTIENLASTDPTFCLQRHPKEGRIRLKENHNYYYQIQGQLYCARRTKCIFFLWSPTEYHMETISFDPEFWSEVLETISAFYLDCLLPELVDPRAPRGQKVREPEHAREIGDCGDCLQSPLDL